MSTREALYLVCDRCGLEHRVEMITNAAARPVYDVGQWGVAYYRSYQPLHDQARAAGWQVQAESTGGDICPACLEDGDE